MLNSPWQNSIPQGLPSVRGGKTQDHRESKGEFSDTGTGVFVGDIFLAHAIVDA